VRASLEEISGGGFSDIELMRAFVSGPPVSFVMPLTIEDHRGVNEHGQELVANLILQVTLPPLYPSESNPPLIEFKDVMITDKLAEHLDDVTLKSIAYFEEPELRSFLLSETAEACAAEGPCIYELVATHLIERAFDFSHMHPFV